MKRSRGSLLLIAVGASLAAGACGDDAGPTLFEVTYAIPASREDIRQLRASVDYAGPSRILASPSGFPARCVSFGGTSVFTDDDLRGRVEILYGECFDFIESDGCGSTIPDDDPDDPDSNPTSSTGSAGIDPSSRRVFRCTYELEETATTDSFAVSVIDASDPQFQQITVDLVVSSVEER